MSSQDSAAESTATEEPPERADTATGTAEDGGSRDIEVPMRVYKAVTVFSTLFAVFTVVGGFVMLDSATNRATAELSEINAPLALLGVGLIVAGAAAYAFSTRFRAAGMGKSKDDTDEGSDNG